MDLLLQRVDYLDQIVHSKDEQIDNLETRLSHRERVASQHHGLIHGMREQMSIINDGLDQFASTSPGVPNRRPLHEDEDNASDISENEVAAQLHNDPTVDSPLGSLAGSPVLPRVHLPHPAPANRPPPASLSMQPTLTRHSDTTDLHSIAPTNHSHRTTRTTGSEEDTIRRLQEDLGMMASSSQPTTSLYPSVFGPPSVSRVPQPGTSDGLILVFYLT